MRDVRGTRSQCMRYMAWNTEAMLSAPWVITLENVRQSNQTRVLNVRHRIASYLPTLTELESRSGLTQQPDHVARTPSSLHELIMSGHANPKSYTACADVPGNVMCIGLPPIRDGPADNPAVSEAQSGRPVGHRRDSRVRHQPPSADKTLSGSRINRPFMLHRHAESYPTKSGKRIGSTYST